MFCTAKYRGRGHVVTEGLTLTAKKLMKSFQPLSSETTVSSVSPLYSLTETPRNATGHGRGRRLQCFILPYKNSSDYNKSKKCVTLLPCARMCDRGSARRARGLKKTGEKGKIYPYAKTRNTTFNLSPPYPAALQGIAKRYRGLPLTA